MTSSNVDVDALLRQLTLDEKILLLAGKNFWQTHAIDRLQIPSLKVTDGPSGARGATFIDGTPAACFPACVSLAATFDPALARRVGQALAEEALSKGSGVLLGPTVCLHRSPLGGRNFESFSEDPLLAGVLASAYVEGLQSQRVAASVKHFFANEQDTRRFVLNETISERALRELYLKPFEIVVKTAKPWTLMSAYPKINGNYVDATAQWLTQVLRKEWGFDGLVMSDWGAASTVACVANGLDLEMPGPAVHTEPAKVHKALSEGVVTEADINARVRASLVLLERTCKFSDRRDTPEERAIDRPEHRALIREAGAAGAVLLKNADHVLPIDVRKTSKIALLGPLAKHASTHGGGSSFLTCHHKISPFEAFEQRFGSSVELSYSKGCEIYRALPDFTEGVTSRDGRPGFDVDYFGSHDGTGPVLKTQHVHRSYLTTHDQIDIKTAAMSARMRATYRPAVSGRHSLSLSGAGVTTLLVDGQVVATQAACIRDAMAFIAGCQDETRAQFDFEAGRAYAIEVLTIMPTVTVSDSPILDKQLCAHVGFVPEADRERDLLCAAVVAARAADVAIVFVGHTHQWESEGQDMDPAGGMALPPYDTRAQDQLIAAVAAVNRRTVVVINTGVPVALPWLGDVAAVVQGWYAGQEVGHALVDVLVGAANPAGKLPMSWPRRYEDSACFGHFGLDALDSCAVTYAEDVFVGYRHYDRHWRGAKEVLFPFGYGLSYTTFDVRDVRVDGSFSLSAADVVSVSARVQNTGDRAGAETLQVYVVPPVPTPTQLQRPLKELAGFAKVHLHPGQEDSIRVELDKAAAAYWDEGIHQWKVLAGSYTILLATSAHPDSVQGQGTVQVPEDFVFGP